MPEWIMDLISNQASWNSLLRVRIPLPVLFVINKNCFMNNVLVIIDVQKEVYNYIKENNLYVDSTKIKGD